MVLLPISKRINQFLGPWLLRRGIKTRYWLGAGVIADNPLLDAALLLPLAQRLISLESREEFRRAWEELHYRKRTVLSSVWFPKRYKLQEGDETLDQASLRIRILSSYLMPVLMPVGRWSEVMQWKFHGRLVKWARAELLWARHGPAVRVALDAFPVLQQVTDGYSKGQVPSSALVEHAFDMQDWATSKNTAALSVEMKRLVKTCVEPQGQVLSFRGGSLCLAVADSEAIVSGGLEDSVELAGGHVLQCGPFNAWCEQADIYQLWTAEYISELGGYLQQRVDRFDGKTVIVDVGAGDGVLAQLLRDYFDGKPLMASTVQRRSKSPTSPKRRRKPKVIPTIVATDNGSWKISQYAPVEALSVDEALEKYAGLDLDTPQQTILLCSWMPMGDDWSKLFRAFNVDEYILIGECDDGQCGDNWETWGNLQALDDPSREHDEILEDSYGEASTSSDPLPGKQEVPHEADGYQRTDLVALEPYQFSRFDCRTSKSGKTVSFRRTRQQPP